MRCGQEPAQRLRGGDDIYTDAHRPFERTAMKTLLPRRVSKTLAWLCAATLSLGANATDLTVSAAASLTNAFKDITAKYQAEHTDARIELNFGASGARTGCPCNQ